MLPLRPAIVDSDIVRRTNVYKNDGRNTKIGRHLPGNTTLRSVSELTGNLCCDRLYENEDRWRRGKNHFWS